MIIKKILKFIWQEFIHGGHLQCLGFAGIVYISSFLLNIKIEWELLLITYLIFYPIYINDRLRGIKIDEATNPERVRHFKKYILLTPRIILFSVLLLTVMLICFANLKFSVFALLLLFFGLLYPFYFKNLTKKINAFKNFYVGFFFTIIALAPVIYYSLSFDVFSASSLAALMILIFSKAFLMQVLLDCKDVESDKFFGLSTLPVLIGTEKTLIFLKISSAFATTFILLFAVFFIRVFPFWMLILFITVPFNFYSYYLVGRKNYFGYVLGSGEFLFWLILIFKINFA